VCASTPATARPSIIRMLARRTVHVEGLRRCLRCCRRPPVDVRGRQLGRQRRCQIVQRDLQTRDPARQAGVHRRTRSSPDLVPLAPPLQHRPTTLPPRTSIPRSPTKTPQPQPICSLRPHNPVSKIRGQAPGIRHKCQWLATANVSGLSTDRERGQGAYALRRIPPATARSHPPRVVDVSSRLMASDRDHWRRPRRKAGSALRDAALRRLADLAAAFQPRMGDG
jgi:hypothetical protein